LFGKYRVGTVLSNAKGILHIIVAELEKRESTDEELTSRKSLSQGKVLLVSVANMQCD